MKVAKYIKTGKEYEITGEAIMKDPATREWIPCYIYTRDGLVFVRAKSEFEDSKRFEIYETKN